MTVDGATNFKICDAIVRKLGKRQNVLRIFLHFLKAFQLKSNRKTPSYECTETSYEYTDKIKVQLKLHRGGTCLNKGKIRWNTCNAWAAI